MQYATILAIYHSKVKQIFQKLHPETKNAIFIQLIDHSTNVYVVENSMHTL